MKRNFKSQIQAARFSKKISRAIFIVLLLLVIAKPTFAETPKSKFEVSIDFQSAGEKDFPYISTVLRVKNNSAQNIDSVKIQLIKGGPIFEYPLTVLPGESETCNVKLYAISKTPEYSVKLFTKNKTKNQLLSLQNTTLNLPSDIDIYKYRRAIIDPKIYNDAPDFQSWSAATKFKIFLFPLGLFCLLFFAKLSKISSVKVVGLSALAIVLLVVGAEKMKTSDTLVDVTPIDNAFSITSKISTMLEISESEKNLRFHKVDNARTIYELGNVYPAYQSFAQMKDDNMIINSNGKMIFSMNPYQQLIFKKIAH